MLIAAQQGLKPQIGIALPICCKQWAVLMCRCGPVCDSCAPSPLAPSSPTPSPPMPLSPILRPILGGFRCGRISGRGLGGYAALQASLELSDGCVVPARRERAALPGRALWISPTERRAGPPSPQGRGVGGRGRCGFSRGHRSGVPLPVLAWA